MKRKSFLCIVLMFALVFMLTSFNVSAQDIAKTNPKYTKVLTDTLGVRIIKVTLAPGEELAMHSHPVYMVYAIQSGQLTSTDKSGMKGVDDLKAGDCAQGPPIKGHIVKNTGTTTCVFLDIEIKDREK